MRTLFLSSVFLYAVFLLMAGVMQIKNENSFDTFCTGSDKNKGVLLGISPQIANTGFWTLFFMPGMIYAYGAGKAWIAVGLFIGTVINWQIMPYRLMRYRAKSDQKIFTLPAYFTERFKEKRPVLKTVSSLLMSILMILFSASLLKEMAMLLEKTCDIPQNAVIIGVVILGALYTAMGGFSGLMNSDFFHSIWVVLCILLCAIVVGIRMNPGEIVINIMNTRVPGDASVYLNVIYDNGTLINPVELISQLSFGLACAGMPNILTGFMAAPNGREINKGRRVVIIWTLISLVAACVMGALCRAYLYPQILTPEESRSGIFYFAAIEKLFLEEHTRQIMAGFFLIAIPIVLISALNSGLLTVTSTLYHDLIKKSISRRFRLQKEIPVFRLLLILVGAVTTAVAIWMPERPFSFLSLAWSLLGCSFGPVVAFSLYWKRMNRSGAIAGLITGTLSVLAWNYLNIFPLADRYINLHTATGMNPILPCFLLSALMIIFVSLITKDVDEGIKREFEEVRNRIM